MSHIKKGVSMLNVNIDPKDIYRLQMEFPDDFYAVLQNFCSFALDYLSKQIDEVIEEANLASNNSRSRSGKSNYREVFTKTAKVELQFEPFITFFSLVRKSMVFESDASGINLVVKGAHIEKVLIVLQGRIAKITEKYPTTNSYGFTVEEYEVEKNNFVKDLTQIKQAMSMLDDDFPKYCIEYL